MLFTSIKNVGLAYIVITELIQRYPVIKTSESILNMYFQNFNVIISGEADALKTIKYKKLDKQ